MRKTNSGRYLYLKRGIYYVSRRVPADLKGDYRLAPFPYATGMGEQPEWSYLCRKERLDVIKRNRPVASYSDAVGVAFIEAIRQSGLHGIMMVSTTPSREIIKRVDQNNKRNSVR